MYVRPFVIILHLTDALLVFSLFPPCLFICFYSVYLCFMFSSFMFQGFMFSSSLIYISAVFSKMNNTFQCVFSFRYCIFHPFKCHLGLFLISCITLFIVFVAPSTFLNMLNICVVTSVILFLITLIYVISVLLKSVIL